MAGQGARCKGHAMSSRAHLMGGVLVGLAVLLGTQAPAFACDDGVLTNGGRVQCDEVETVGNVSPTPQLTGELSTQDARALPAVSAEEVVPPPPPCTDVIAVGVPRSPDGQICRVRT